MRYTSLSVHGLPLTTLIPPETIFTVITIMMAKGSATFMIYIMLALQTIMVLQAMMAMQQMMQPT